MANALNYYEYKPYVNATIAGSTRIVLPSGLGNFNQLTCRVVVGDVTGGADTIDFDVDTSFTKDSAGNDVWTEVLSMTQNTGASSETKVEVRDGTATWADRFSLEVTVGAGATATGVNVTIIGANAATTA